MAAETTRPSRLLELLNQPLLDHGIRRHPPASTSAKTWAASYQILQWNPSDNVKADLGHDPTDQSLQVRRELHLFHLTLRSEGDVVMQFVLHVLQPIAWAFPPRVGLHSEMKASVRNEVASGLRVDIVIEDTTRSGKVHCMAVGECKKPGVIRPKDWESPRTRRQSENSKHLGEELLG